MTPPAVRAAAHELVGLHGRFAPRFGRQEACAPSLVYLNGLLGAEGRTRAAPRAPVFGQPHEGEVRQRQVRARQRFRTDAPGDAQDSHRAIQAAFAEQLAPSTSRWPRGTVAGSDAAGFVTKGTGRVGVQRH